MSRKTKLQQHKEAKLKDEESYDEALEAEFNARQTYYEGPPHQSPNDRLSPYQDDSSQTNYVAPGIESVEKSPVDEEPQVREDVYLQASPFYHLAGAVALVTSFYYVRSMMDLFFP